MGACYTTTLSVRLTDEQSAFSVLREYMLGDKGTNYNFPRFAKIGIKSDSFINLIRILLADWNNRLSLEAENGWMTFSNDFDASYGWIDVMLNCFKEIMPYIDPDSFISVNADNDTVTLTGFGQVVYDKEAI